MKCLICDTDYKRLGLHIKIHQITTKQYYDTYLKKPGEGICPVCGKETPFFNMVNGYQKHCCAACGIKDSQTKEKYKQSMISKYGVSYPSQRKNHIEMVKQTKLEKYGDENYNNREKAKQTSLDHYGVDVPIKSDEIKQKVKRTCLEKYNCECNFQRKEVIEQSKQTKKEKYGSETYNNQEKRKQTCLKKYGVNDSLKSEDIRNKIKQTNLSRYNVECNLQVEEVKEKIKQTNREKYNADYYVQSEDFSRKVKNTVLNGPNSINTIWRSKQEDIIIKAINSIYTGLIYTNNRKIIYPKELDIYIPELKLAIEFNGLLYHSSAVNYAKESHLNKSLLCRAKEIRLIHIYEFEDLDEQIELLKSLILGKDMYSKEDFNKNNLIDNIPEPEIVYQDSRYTVYGAGKLYVYNKEGSLS